MTGAARSTSRRLALVAAGLLVITPVRGSEAAPGAGVRTPQRADRVHIVKDGESLPGIAENYGVSVKAILAANKLKSAPVRLRIGQRLVIPMPRVPAAERAPRVPFNMVLSIPDFDGRLVPFEWPIEGTVISQFGRRRTGWHRGLDIKAEMGTPVFAAAAGIVTASGVEPRYGKVVKIEHANNFMTVYAHHLQNFVSVGDEVDAGQVIGQVGRTGRATAYHLHFEIRYEGSVYNPLYLLPSPPRMAEVGDTGEEPSDDE